ncbi:hypothetical protein BGZ90_000084, partial [Linnemannia elongata]
REFSAGFSYRDMSGRRLKVSPSFSPFPSHEQQEESSSGNTGDSAAVLVLLKQFQEDQKQVREEQQRVYEKLRVAHEEQRQTANELRKELALLPIHQKLRSSCK